MAYDRRQVCHKRETWEKRFKTPQIVDTQKIKTPKIHYKPNFKTAKIYFISKCGLFDLSINKIRYTL